MIDESNGNITVAAGAILDAETQNVFFLTVLANNIDRISTTLLEIDLKDVNDVNPVFNLGPNEELISIQEPGEVGEILVMVTVSIVFDIYMLSGAAKRAMVPSFGHLVPSFYKYQDPSLIMNCKSSIVNLTSWLT